MSSRRLSFVAPMERPEIMSKTRLFVASLMLVLIVLLAALITIFDGGFKFFPH